jgi:hypothetical protein
MTQVLFDFLRAATKNRPIPMNTVIIHRPTQRCRPAQPAFADSRGFQIAMVACDF